MPQYGEFGDAARIAEFAAAEELDYRSFWVDEALEVAEHVINSV